MKEYLRAGRKPDRLLFSAILFLLTCSGLYAQDKKTISGIIRDENKLPVAGVSITEKGSTNATSSSSTGAFNLQVSPQATLILKFIGYKTLEVNPGERTSLAISIEPATLSLNTVVVIGYGSQRKVDVTGSVASVNKNTIRERPSINALGALAGQVAGVNITSNSGRPGDYRINIRGFNSINASNSPLFVIDGVIGADYSTINPNDIETIDVLKDASATAIYGARGSGGVIILTTKRGLNGKTSISYDFSAGINVLPREIPVLNSSQYTALEKAAFSYIHGRAYPAFGTLEPLLYKPDGTPRYNTDWQKELYRPSFSQNHNLSISGGNPDLKFNINYGYQDEQALMLLTYNKKNTVRINLDARIHKWLTAGLSLSGVYGLERIQDDGVGGLTATREALEELPVIPVRLPDGSWGGDFMHLGSEGSDNPVNLVTNHYNLFKRVQGLANAYFTLKFSNALEFKTSFSGSVNNIKNDFSNSGSAVQRGLYGNITAGENTDNSVYWQSSNYFTYTKKFGKHNINAILGAEWAKTADESFGATTSNFDGDFYLYNNLGAGTVPSAPASGSYEWQLNSYFTRLIYSYNDKYLFTATRRYDGSSKFGINHRYAFFPSAAIAWRVSEEEYLKGSHTISNLKLRLSTGSTGNSEIIQYQSLSALSTNTAIFSGSRAGGEVQGTIPNPDLKWEKTNQQDLGIDLGLFSSRINLTADIYNKVTHDLLLYAPVPVSSGYDNVLKNIGSVRNREFELSLNTYNLTGEVKWSTNLNFSINRNKILTLGTHNEDIFPGPGFLDQTNILRVGQAVGTYFGLVRQGTWGMSESAPAAKYGAKPGDLKEKDLNGDGIIDGRDRTIIGHAYPKFTGELINKFSYKNFDLLLDIQVSQGNNILNLAYATSEDRQTVANNYRTVLNAWTPVNQQTSIAQVRLNSDGPSLRQDSHYIQDGSFIRGRNISLAYSFPKKIADQLHIINLRLFAGIQNAFLITKYKTGYDPEVSTYSQAFAYGIEFYAQPKARIFNFGCNVTF